MPKILHHACIKLLINSLVLLQITTQQPVHQSVNTSSTYQRLLLQEIQLSHSELKLGVLKEGCIYLKVITLTNTGVNTCRFKLMTPPPSTGIKVYYNPGPVSSVCYKGNRL